MPIEGSARDPNYRWSIGSRARPVAEFLLDIHCPSKYVVHHAESVPHGRLDRRLEVALLDRSCDVLLIHRDAEKQEVSAREEEIRTAVETVSLTQPALPHVCIVPVRMTEAWLLLDEAAIRRAAGNPNGRTPLALPAPDRVESIDAKEYLTSLLEAASELGARRLRTFDRARARSRVAGFIDNMTALRQLPSFRHFEAQLVRFFDVGTNEMTA